MSMVLIKSISGIKGTLGDDENSLNPNNLSRFVRIFTFPKKKNRNKKNNHCCWKRWRESGQAFIKIVNKTLSICGIHVSQY